MQPHCTFAEAAILAPLRQSAADLLERGTRCMGQPVVALDYEGELGLSRNTGPPQGKNTIYWDALPCSQKATGIAVLPAMQVRPRQASVRWDFHIPALISGTVPRTNRGPKCSTIHWRHVLLHVLQYLPHDHAMCEPTQFAADFGPIIRRHCSQVVDVNKRILLQNLQDLFLSALQRQLTGLLQMPVGIVDLPESMHVLRPAFAYCRRHHAN